MKPKNLKLGMIVSFFFILTFNSKADVKPAKIFSSNMVLQKGIENTIWGWADKKFHWAKAKLIDDNTVVVYSEEVKSPVAVRYGWANNPDDLNLYNKEGLPVDPFRTDNWPGITK